MMRCEDCKAYIPAEKVIEGQLHTMRYGTCKLTGLCHEARDKACKKRFEPLMPGDFAAPKKHICPICGAEFTAEPPSKKYCSEECKTRANRESSHRQYLKKKQKAAMAAKKLTLPQCEKIAAKHKLSYGLAEAAGLFRKGCRA